MFRNTQSAQNETVQTPAAQPVAPAVTEQRSRKSTERYEVGNMLLSGTPMTLATGKQTNIAIYYRTEAMASQPAPLNKSTKHPVTWDEVVAQLTNLAKQGVKARLDTQNILEASTNLSAGAMREPVTGEYLNEQVLEHLIGRSKLIISGQLKHFGEGESRKAIPANVAAQIQATQGDLDALLRVWQSTPVLREYEADYRRQYSIGVTPGFVWEGAVSFGGQAMKGLFINAKTFLNLLFEQFMSVGTRVWVPVETDEAGKIKLLPEPSGAFEFASVRYGVNRAITIQNLDATLNGGVARDRDNIPVLSLADLAYVGFAFECETGDPVREDGRVPVRATYFLSLGAIAERVLGKEIMAGWTVPQVLRSSQQGARRTENRTVANVRKLSLVW